MENDILPFSVVSLFPAVVEIEIIVDLRSLNQKHIVNLNFQIDVRTIPDYTIEPK